MRHPKTGHVVWACPLIPCTTLHHLHPLPATSSFPRPPSCKQPPLHHARVFHNRHRLEIDKSVGPEIAHAKPQRPVPPRLDLVHVVHLGHVAEPPEGGAHVGHHLGITPHEITHLMVVARHHVILVGIEYRQRACRAHVMGGIEASDGDVLPILHDTPVALAES